MTLKQVQPLTRNGNKLLKLLQCVVFKNVRENKKSYAQFLWLCIILMEAANQVAAYISKLDQPIRWINLFWETLINIHNM